MALHRRLHHDVVLGRQGLRVDEIIRQRRVLAAQMAEQAIGVIRDLLLAAGSVGHQHVARVAEAEHRLQPGGNIVGQQRDRAGRRHRGQQRVADAVSGDRVAHVRVERGDGFAVEVFFPVEQRERALLGGKLGRGEIGRALDRREP